MKANYFIAVNIEECEVLISTLQNAVKAAKFIKELEAVDNNEDCNPRIQMKSKEFPDENSTLDFDMKIEY